MKRKDIVSKLIKEGFSEKTLTNLNDKQLNLLFNRLNEQATSVINVSKDDKINIEKAKKGKTPFITYEEDESMNLENEKFHPITTKKEITEMIMNKLKK